MQKILVAYDGSEPADKAFDLALDLARCFHAEIYVLAVIRLPEPAADIETEAIMENAREYFEELFEALGQKSLGLETALSFETVVGHPAEQIISFAEAKKIDHIVMGHRGKTLFQKWLVGSVAKRVMSYAPCSVTIVRG